MFVPLVRYSFISSRILSLTSPPFNSIKHSRHSRYLVRSIEHPAKSHLHSVEEAACRRTERAFKLRAVIGGWKKKWKRATRFRRSGITCGEKDARNERDAREEDTNNARGGRLGGRGIVDGKTGGSAPTEFFGGITDLYFTPDLPSDVYVFNILDASARVRARTSASMHSRSMPNAQRSTNSYLLPFHSTPRRVFARLRFPLISTQIRDLLSACLSLSAPSSLLSLSHIYALTLLPFPSRSLSSRAFNIFVLVPRISSPFLACSLRDSLKSFSLCSSAIHFPE